MHRKIFCFAAACMVMVFPFNGYGKSLSGLVKDGNTAYNDGEYDNAVAAYDEALKDADDSPYVYFNKGAALYKKGDYSGAADAFEKAAINSKDKRFEAKSRFNLGNTAYKEAESQKDKDLQKAFDSCSKSVSHYREALNLDPDLKEAAENMEMVRLVMKNILDEMQKQKESDQKEQEQKEEAADKLKEIIKEQEAALEKNKGLQKEQTGKNDAGAMNKKIGELADEQEAIKDKTESLAKEWPKDQTEDSASDEVPASKHLENAAKEQDAAYGNLGQKNTREAAKNQEDAIKELKEALDSLEEEGNNVSGQDNKDQQEEQQQESAGDQTQDAPDQSLDKAGLENVSDDAQDILNDEKENKEQRKALMMRSYKEVDKDW